MTSAEPLVAAGPSGALKLPDMALREVVNLTRYKHYAFQKMGPGRTFFDCLVLKVSYTLASGLLREADVHAAPVLSDRYRAAPAARSSIAALGDLHLAKPRMDVLVAGTAVTYRRRPERRWRCGLSVSTGSMRAAHHLVATGPRSWERRLTGWVLEEPAPTSEVPIRYELAYGGASATAPYAANPCGLGVVPEERSSARDPLQAPQWEHSEDPIVHLQSRHAVAGFGPVARFCEPRVGLAGTYTKEWRARLAGDALRGLVPDYAPDFDPRFFCSAPSPMQLAWFLTGDEVFTLQGLLEDAAETSFSIPRLKLRLESLWPTALDLSAQLRGDTIWIDVDARRVDVTYRLVLPPEAAVECLMIEQE